MRVSFSIGVYARKDGEEEWTGLIPARYKAYVSGTNESWMRDRMIDRLRDAVRSAFPVDQDLFQLPLASELVRLPIDVKSKGGTIHGQLPLIVEPRWVSESEQRLFVYHPMRR